jgi:hypothetical protein
MATLSIKRTGQLVRTTSGRQPRIYAKCKEANSSTFVVGDLVYITSQAVTVCGSDPSTIAGIALKAGSNTTTANKYIPILVLDGDTEFSMSLYHGTAASATVSDESLKLSVAYGIVKVAAGKWAVDLSETGSTRVEILDYPVQGEALGDIYMQVMCKVLAANRQTL